MALPFLGFPFVLPALYLQTAWIYSTLAITGLSLQLVLALVGFDSLDSMRQPLLLSTSIKDFWGRRWNLVIHNLMKRTFFLPFARRGGTAARHFGALLSFIMSGLFHEYMWLITNWFQMDKYTIGFPVAFFLIQFVAAAVESILAKTSMGKMVAGLPNLVRTVCTTLVILPFGPLFLQGLQQTMTDSAAVFPTLRSQI